MKSFDWMLRPKSLQESSLGEEQGASQAPRASVHNPFFQTLPPAPSEGSGETSSHPAMEKQMNPFYATAPPVQPENSEEAATATPALEDEDTWERERELRHGMSRGQIQRRKCRDLLWLVLLGVVWVGLAALAVYGYNNGDPAVLLYGPDYAGNVCNQRRGGVDLRGFRNRYFVHPNQVAAAERGLSSLEEAVSVCVRRCPQTLPQGNLTWICKYPYDQWDVHVQGMSMDEWDELNYDYFHRLDGNQIASSLLLQGPCYPVLSFTRSIFHTCDFTPLEAPLLSVALEEFQACVANCAALTLPDAYVECVNVQCQAATVLEEGPSIIHPIAYSQFKAEARSRGLDFVHIPPPLTEEAGAGQAVEDLLARHASVMERYFADFQTTKYVVVACGAMAPFVLGFIWMGLMRVFAGPLVWGTLLLANLMSLALAVLLFLKAGVFGVAGIDHVPDPPQDSNATWQDGIGAVNQSDGQLDESESVYLSALSSEVDEEAKRALAVCGAVMFVLWLFIATASVLMYRRLKITVAVLQVAAEVVAKAPAVVLYPVIPFVFLCGFSLVMMVSALYVYSSGELVPQPCAPFPYNTVSRSVQDGTAAAASTSGDGVGNATLLPDGYCGYAFNLDRDLSYMLLYMLFGFYWTAEFVVAVGLLTIASVAFRVYSHQGPRPLPPSLVSRSIRRTLRYHLGSAALGSLVLLPARVARGLVQYVQSSCEGLMRRNPWLKCTLYCLKCALWAMDRGLAFVSRNAYVLIAIDGDSFCESAGRATNLIFRWAFQIAVINTVGDFILLLGRVCITGTCAVLAMLLLESPQYKHDISSPLPTTLLVGGLALIVSSMFMAVVEMVIDCVTLAFCEECSRTNGHPTNAPDKLKNAIDFVRQYQDEMDQLRQEQRRPAIVTAEA